MAHYPIPNPRCRPNHKDDLLLKRAQFLDTIRHFFRKEGFLEVETPILISHADPSPHLNSFKTTLHQMDGSQRTLFLQTSPEFAMKRLVAAGYERIFQITKFFRNGEITDFHNPEFTGLEWYAIGFDYTYIMELTEKMVLALWPEGKLHYQGRRIDLSPPWKRISVYEAMEHYTGLKFPAPASYEDLLKACQTLGLSTNPEDSWDDLFFRIFLTYVDPHLGQDEPTFLYDYPIEMAALARAKKDKPYLAERVELYIGGLELANGYSELNDPLIQTQRWLAEVKSRTDSGENCSTTPDPNLINALKWGMADCTGVALGLDRFLMLYLDTTTIQEVLPFPMTSYPPED